MAIFAGLHDHKKKNVNTSLSRLKWQSVKISKFENLENIFIIKHKHFKISLIQLYFFGYSMIA